MKQTPGPSSASTREIEGEQYGWSSECRPRSAPVEELSARLVANDEGEWDPRELEGLTIAEEAVTMANFTPEEVVCRLRRFENSAPGEDQIDYKAWRAVDPAGKLLSAIFNMCVKYRRVPAEWKLSRTIFIPKNESPSTIGDWRPIALSRTIYKIYAGVLADRIMAWCRVHEAISPHQKGFTAFDGVHEHNYVLHQRLVAARKRREEICVAWLDITDAFGSIPHALITGALDKKGAGQTVVDIVKDIYKDNFTTVSSQQEVSGLLRVTRGIKQGCPLSGLLFILGIDHVIRRLDNGGEHTVLAYADDLCLLSRTPEGLQDQLSKAAEALEKVGMLLNPTKCKTFHLSGATPVGVRNTTFNIKGVQLTALKEGETQRFLGNPVGFQAVAPRDKIQEIVEKALAIMSSGLAPWQRLDALKTFIYPAMNFHMRNGTFSKSEWGRVDDIIRAEVKKCLGVPTEAANEYLYGARSEGLCGFPIAAEESDLAMIDGAFKLLTSQDDKLRQLATSDLSETVRARTLPGHSPDPGAYLSGAVNEGMRGRSSQVGDKWTKGRTASQRMGVQWTFQEDIPSVKCGETAVQSYERHELLRKLRHRKQVERGEALRQKVCQGRVCEVLKKSPESSHYLHSGDFLSFADWRFVHKARLQLLKLNGCRRYGGQQDKACRRCGFANESPAHVLSQCNTHTVLRQIRHDAIVERLEETAKHRGYRVVSKNAPVGNLRLRPDLVVSKGDQAIILEVTCPFENRQEAFDEARKAKQDKYAPLKTSLLTEYREVKVAPIIVGALGTWDPRNNKYLTGLTTRAFLAKMIRLVVCETLSWSRCIYMTHTSGRPQRPVRWKAPTREEQARRDPEPPAPDDDSASTGRTSPEAQREHDRERETGREAEDLEDLQDQEHPEAEGEEEDDEEDDSSGSGDEDSSGSMD